MNPAGFPDYQIIGATTEIPFNSGTPDINGCYWYLDGTVAGWDSPDTRSTMLTKIGVGPVADGEIPADLHYRGRTLSMKLYAACPTEAAREEAWYLATQTLDMLTPLATGWSGTDLNNSGGVFYVNEEVPKRLFVWRAGNSGQGKLVMTEKGLSAMAQISRGFTLPVPGDSVNELYWLEADIELYASDPRKYTQSHSTVTVASSSAAITNQGNAVSAVMGLTITSGISGQHGPLNLTLAGQTMQLVVPTLPSSAPTPPPFPAQLVIRFDNKTIQDNSGNNYYYLRNLQTPWLTLPPGPQTLTVSGLDIDGAVLTWNSAWL